MRKNAKKSNMFFWVRCQKFFGQVGSNHLVNQMEIIKLNKLNKKMDFQSNPHQIVGSQNVIASSFGAKFSSKGEIWRFLTTEAGIYLPSYDTVTIWHLKDVAAGTKKVGISVVPSFHLVDTLREGDDNFCSSI